MRDLSRITSRLRRFALLSSLAAACTIPPRSSTDLGSTPIAEHSANNLVRTRSGLVQGAFASDASVSVFKGVPFAAPPVGSLRFAAPKPVVTWKGVRDATVFSKSCAQKEQRVYLPWTEEFHPTNEYSEDCLALNIWAPQSAKGAKPSLKPVFVNIHGGAFTGGSGEVPVLDGEAFARLGIVVVTINYRLGAFGFYCHSDLAAESEDNGCGNFGLLDQVAALRWVQANIAAFGGDPNNVTIGGQSAGASSVHFLSAAPQARGLFHRMLAQSGAWDRHRSTPRLQDAEAQGERFLKKAKVASVAELRKLPWQEVVAYTDKAQERFAPVVDGVVVQGQLHTLIEQRAMADVPLLTGLTAHELSFLSQFGKATLAQFKEKIRQKYGSKSEAILKLYGAATDAEAGLQEMELQRDTGLATLLDCRTLRSEMGEAKDYGYLFERSIPWPEHPEYQAFHSADLPYAFSNLNKLDRPWQAIDMSLATLMSSYWVNFISTGDPNGSGLPVWPSSPGQIMVFGESSHSRATLDSDRAQLLRSPVVVNN